jgi:2'-5' RNA ligase
MLTGFSLILAPRTRFDLNRCTSIMPYWKIDMNAIRSFIAIELPKNIHQQLDHMISQLKSPRTSAVRWVPAHNIHLTIKFLGDVSPTNMQLLMDMLKAEVSQLQTFNIRVAGLGAYPTPKRPRVLWVGVEAPPLLTSLVHLVEAETVKLGYLSEDRAFSPHLTLGRVSQNATPDQVHQIAEALAGMQVGELGTTEVREVVLFKSDLHPSGAEYTPLLKVLLQNGK